MAELKYITGTATNPKGTGRKIIAHICNDMGEWGEGFLLPLSQKWVQPELAYREWHRKGYYKENRRKTPFQLGQIQLIPLVEYDISIVNMITLKGLKFIGTEPPIRYKAYQQCLQKLSTLAQAQKSSVHMPQLNPLQTGAQRELIEEFITHELIEKEINVYIYDQ